MIRLASVAPRFKHGDVIDLVRSWTEFQSLTDDQRALLRDRHGRWIRIHPDDRAELAQLGLRFVNGIDPLAEIAAKPTENKKADPAENPKKADKADGKKG